MSTRSTTETSQEMSSSYCINLTDVQCAAQRIKGTAYETPVLTSTSINDVVLPRHCQFYFKVEALQRTGSFKFRGALNAVRSILEEDQQQKEKSTQLDVVTHSSGNHAQALALAAKLSSTESQRVTATIVMPESTPIVKKNAVVVFGGIPVMTANTNEARESEADRIRQETGARFVHPSEDSLVIAGQGTVCLEFIEQVRNAHNVTLDAVIIPVGGGGLASGNAITLRGLLGDRVKIILAEPQLMDDAKRSFDAKTLLPHHSDNPLNSVADGLKTTLGPNTFPIVRDLVDDIITVSEVEILTATKLVWERLKVCIEPSAGVGVAVALSEKFQKKYASTEVQHVGIVLCGGNVDVIKISRLMHELGI